MKVYSVVILFFVAVGLAFGLNCVNGYFYPVKYVAEITTSAEKYGVEPKLIASVINVESSYKPNRVSNKGAKGLMQLMPSTAEWLCQLKGEEFNEERLFEPAYNIDLGAFYLSYLKKCFEEEKTAICAYNAGLGNVRSWLKDERYSLDSRTLKVVPFKETANYLVKINKNLAYYSRKF